MRTKMSTETSPPENDADAYWRYVERVAKQVDAWPKWKKGERSQERDETKSIDDAVPSSGSAAAKTGE
jgi:hypothetical protein